MNYNIAYFSSNRSDYGIAKHFLKRIDSSNKFNLHIIVSGNHFLKKFGYSYAEIKKNNYKLVNLLRLEEKDLNRPYFKLAKLHDIFIKKKINFLILLGDRFETLICANIAHFLNIPILHLHGGEKTSGSKDDNYRHSISKLSQYHFVTHQDYKKRLIQLGEKSSSIFNFGPFAYENIVKSLEEKPSFDKYEITFLNLRKKMIVVNFHSSKTSINYNASDFMKILICLSKIKDIKILFTAPNPDIGYKHIINYIRAFVKKNTSSIFIPNLGQKKYFHILNFTDIVIGNSSSGIIEVPYFKIPVINVGDRQKGRLSSSYIFNTDLKSNSLDSLIKKLLLRKKKKLHINKNYEVSKKMFHILKKIDFAKIKLTKDFKDL